MTSVNVWWSVMCVRIRSSIQVPSAVTGYLHACDIIVTDGSFGNKCITWLIFSASSRKPTQSEMATMARSLYHYFPQLSSGPVRFLSFCCHSVVMVRISRHISLVSSGFKSRLYTFSKVKKCADFIVLLLFQEAYYAGTRDGKLYNKVKNLRTYDTLVTPRPPKFNAAQLPVLTESDVQNAIVTMKTLDHGLEHNRQLITDLHRRTMWV